VPAFFDETPPLVSSSWPGHRNISVIRGDLLHPIVSGNKLFKLLPIIQKAQKHKIQTLISVGGRYSNHLHALAWAGKSAGLETIGIVQGYEAQNLTSTLKDCLRWEMKIHFVGKVEFRSRYEDEFWQKWQADVPSSLRINEGGWSPESIKGSALWWDGIENNIDFVICAVGSGGTLAGLALSAPNGVRVIGVPVFKDPGGYRDLRVKLKEAGVDESLYTLWEGFAGKGFGSLTEEQKHFALQFSKTSGIQLDPVYTAKVFHALSLKIEKNPDLMVKKIAVLHTGGLQGCRS